MTDHGGAGPVGATTESSAVYRIAHSTHYRYGAPVARSRDEVHLRPRDTAFQTCRFHELEIDPPSSTLSERSDYFGNPVAAFAVDGPFDRMTVVATSVVEVRPRTTPEHAMRSWEEVRDEIDRHLTPELLAAVEYRLESPLVARSATVREFAESSFATGRPMLEAVAELTGRIFTGFTYDPGFTTVTTPVEEVLAHRRGVCQDFAHLAVGCLRSMGLAARYVSGYLETAPPPGSERLTGSDASHAWPSVYVPGGWIDVDPTNGTLVDTRYVTTAWGRDYADVSPLKGVVFGGGEVHTLDVEVDVTRCEGSEADGGRAVPIGW